MHLKPTARASSLERDGVQNNLWIVLALASPTQQADSDKSRVRLHELGFRRKHSNYESVDAVVTMNQQTIKIY